MRIYLVNNINEVLKIVLLLRRKYKYKFTFKFCKSRILDTLESNLSIFKLIDILMKRSYLFWLTTGLFSIVLAKILDIIY